MKVLIGSVIVAIILIMSSCIFVAGTHKHDECPVCEGCTEGIEDPYLCSKYYEAVEEPVLNGEWGEPQTGSFDFFLEEEDSLVATKCLTCGIHFTHPSYGEHIKTCCP